jgi:hypothetical protein
MEHMDGLFVQCGSVFSVDTMPWITRSNTRNVIVLDKLGDAANRRKRARGVMQVLNVKNMVWGVDTEKGEQNLHFTSKKN